MRLIISSLLAALVLNPAQAEPSGFPGVDIKVRQDGDVIIVDCVMHTDVSQDAAWAVLTDFEHMVRFVPNVHESHVLERHGEQLRVQQKGVARYGVLSFSFESLRDIELKPISEIRSRAVGGNVKQMEGTTQLSHDAGGTTIVFHSTSVPGVWVPPMLGLAFVRNEVAEQFHGMLLEMQKRKPPTLSEPRPAT
ncbi:SRPBCC family protein [Chitinivorax sp. PXF-14]|uniref:SRPBCC family protein n=1 Tax=Chitinivorax sp. PXF-14 TaxID=3230488 RepID=UPI003465F36C